MPKERINPAGLHDAANWYTHVVKVRGGTTVYVAGQVAIAGGREIVGRGDYHAQSVVAFENLKQALEAAGASPGDVVKINVYVVNYCEEHLGGLEAGMNACFGDERGFTCVVAGVQALALEGLLVEVEAVAVME